MNTFMSSYNVLLCGMFIDLQSQSLGRTCYDTDKKQKYLLVCLTSLIKVW